MQVYVGQFRYINEGETEVFLATTEDKIKELLTQQMLVYIDWTDDFVLPPQQNYDALTQIGYNNEWFEVNPDQIGKLALVIGKSTHNPEMAYAVCVLETGRRDSYHYSRLEKL